MNPMADTQSSEPDNRMLHPSTIVFLLFVVVILLLLNIPGQIVVGPDIFVDGKYGPHFPAYEHYEHGWPVTYMSREPMMLSGPRYVRLSLWQLFKGVEQFSVAALLADVATALAALFAGSLLFEAWRRRRTRLLQFSLSELVVFVSLVALVCSILAMYRSRHHGELDALQSIAKTETEGVEWGIPVHERAAWQLGGPSWLREIVGGRPFHIFDRVVGIYVTGNELEHAVKLRNLKVICIFGSVSNRQLRLLEQCRQLEALDMHFARVEHEGPELIDENGYVIEPCFQLPLLPNLRGINLYDTAFRGEGLENLRSVENLDLSDDYIDDEGLSAIGGLPHLRVLSLAGTEVTNAGLRHLSSLGQLQELWLGFTSIGDEGVGHLAGLRELRSLDLYGVEITDAAIPVLKQLAELQYLNLHNTSVTEDGIDELRKALPNCRVHH